MPTNINIIPIKLDITAIAIGALVSVVLKSTEVPGGGEVDGSSAKLIAPGLGCIDMVSCETGSSSDPGQRRDASSGISFC